MRHYFWAIVVVYTALALCSYFFSPALLWVFVLALPIVLLGIYNALQNKHTILKNFPILGYGRYLLELVRPEIQQYFIEDNHDGRPISREHRSIVYQRAKKSLDSLPFGTQLDVYKTGYEWMSHSVQPLHLEKDKDFRIKVGGASTGQPYSASLLNISAMSYGSLSKTALEALNGGAKFGGFAHNTGEGGVSPYHYSHGGDLIWQIGTGYFGCRFRDGTFCVDKFADEASRPEIKMIELKLSQGAKPGHGGILPSAKVTEEISKIRHVEMGQDVLSPPGHSAFSTPIELLEFIALLREKSGSKPVGFKLCIGKPHEFFAICKAMVRTKIYPDFIAVDGGEGGTGAAPLEFSNSLGAPLTDGLRLVHNSLIGFGLRDKMKIIASGHIYTGFHLIKRLALGADLCYSARGMMLALGCIQALRCNSNHCPTGVATQNKTLYNGLDVSDKRKRVASFHRETIESVTHMLSAMGLSHPDDLRPHHLMQRVSKYKTKNYGEIYQYLKGDEFLSGEVPEEYQQAFGLSSAESFAEAVNGV